MATQADGENTSNLVQHAPSAVIKIVHRLKIEHETDRFGNLVLTFHSLAALRALKNEVDALKLAWAREYGVDA